MTDKPDNSPTFFSARKPGSTIYPMSSAKTVYPKPADHPWRYFIAGGESLAKIEQYIAESHTVAASLKALANEVGADGIEGGAHFVFNKAEVELIAPKIRLVYDYNQLFECDASASGKFFPNTRYGEGADIRKTIVEIAKLSGDEAQSARAALAKKYKATSFDGTFFEFADWEHHVRSAPIGEKQFRLKSNPLFLRGPHDQTYFSPDMERDEGIALSGRLREITMRQYPPARFANWIASFELDISLNGRDKRDKGAAEAEKFGNEWIIGVPVIVEGIYGEDGKGGVISGLKEGWVLPPGAKPIAVSEYFALLEKTGTLRSLPKA